MVDSLTEKPVTEAHIQLQNGSVLVTDMNGEFELPVSSTNIQLQISHSSYGIHNIERQIPFDIKRLVIKISVLTKKIDEVQISGERLRILTRKKGFSIYDIEFDNDNLWMILLDENMGSKQFIALANQFGDTLATKRIDRGHRLVKDVFGNVLLENVDSVFQLFSPDQEKIQLLYGENSQRYHQIASPYMVSFNQKLVFCEYNRAEEDGSVYYLDNEKPGKNKLTHIVDSLEVIRKKMEREHTGSIWLDLKKTRYWMANTKISEIYEHDVRVPMFSLNDTLYIINIFCHCCPVKQIKMG